MYVSLRYTPNASLQRAGLWIEIWMESTGLRKREEFYSIFKVWWKWAKSENVTHVPTLCLTFTDTKKSEYMYKNIFKCFYIFGLANSTHLYEEHRTGWSVYVSIKGKASFPAKCQLLLQLKVFVCYSEPPHIALVKRKKKRFNTVDSTFQNMQTSWLRPRLPRKTQGLGFGSSAASSGEETVALT